MIVRGIVERGVCDAAFEHRSSSFCALRARFTEVSVEFDGDRVQDAANAARGAITDACGCVAMRTWRLHNDAKRARELDLRRTSSKHALRVDSLRLDDKRQTVVN